MIEVTVPVYGLTVPVTTKETPKKYELIGLRDTTSYVNATKDGDNEWGRRNRSYRRYDSKFLHNCRTYRQPERFVFNLSGV